MDPPFVESVEFVGLARLSFITCWRLGGSPAHRLNRERLSRAPPCWDRTVAGGRQPEVLSERHPAAGRRELLQLHAL